MRKIQVKINPNRTAQAKRTIQVVLNRKESEFVRLIRQLAESGIEPAKRYIAKREATA